MPSHTCALSHTYCCARSFDAKRLCPSCLVTCHPCRCSHIIIRFFPTICFRSTICSRSILHSLSIVRFFATTILQVPEDRQLPDPPLLRLESECYYAYLSMVLHIQSSLSAAHQDGCRIEGRIVELCIANLRRYEGDGGTQSTLCTSFWFSSFGFLLFWAAPTTQWI